MSSIKFKKIQFDTKYKTPDSPSTSNFKVELPETLFFENNSVFMLMIQLSLIVGIQLKTSIQNSMFAFMMEQVQEHRQVIHKIISLLYQMVIIQALIQHQKEIPNLLQLVVVIIVFMLVKQILYKQEHQSTFQSLKY